MGVLNFLKKLNKFFLNQFIFKNYFFNFFLFIKCLTTTLKTLNLKTIMKSSKKQEFDKNSVEDNDNEVENDCFYDLVAVEMHSGDAAGGHFFSYCGPPCTSRKNM